MGACIEPADLAEADANAADYPTVAAQQCGLIERLEEDADYIDNYDCFVGSQERIVRTMRDAAAYLSALPASEAGWRDMESAPTTGFFLAWSPDFPDMVSCWKAELFHQARKPGTPRHLSANHFTLWRPLNLPSAPDRRAAT
jgi:hypothetical protein